MANLKRILKADLLTVYSIIREGDLDDIGKLHGLIIIRKCYDIIKYNLDDSEEVTKGDVDTIVAEIELMIDDISFEELHYTSLATDKLMIITNTIDLIKTNFILYGIS